MSILLDETTRVIIQGFTGDKGTFHGKEMIAYGTNLVGGVTPGKGGTRHLDRPVFNTVKEAVREAGAEASLIFVPASFCADAIMEAADAGIRLVVTITDGIPAQDMMRVKRYLWRYPRERKTTLIGPNCAGVISAGKAMMGIMPSHIYRQGSVGLVTRSGTLSYEAASQMKALGIGITTSVGIGGDPINGTSFKDILALFEEDDETEAVMMIGEIGGPQEADAATFFKENMTKPVIGYIAGLTAPTGRRMGHAGAIISAFGDSAAEKAEILRSAGLTVASSAAELGKTVAAALARRPSRTAVSVPTDGPSVARTGPTPQAAATPSPAATAGSRAVGTPAGSPSGPPDAASRAASAAPAGSASPAGSGSAAGSPAGSGSGTPPKSS